MLIINLRQISIVPDSRNLINCKCFVQEDDIERYN